MIARLPFPTDSLTVCTRIERIDGVLTVVGPNDNGLSQDQQDAVRVATRIGEQHIARVTAAERDAFQHRVATHQPAPG